MKQNYLAVAVIAGAVLMSSFLFKPTVNVTVAPDASLGATPGGDFYNQVNFAGGVVNSTNVSTSTNAAATITAAELTQWTRASVVSLIPNVVAAATFTLPASSTVPNIVPRAGDRAQVCVRNATTTANIALTLAGSTGINLTVASTSVSALGSKILLSGKVGCIEFVRQVQTATTFDIDALLTVYQ